MVETDKIKIKGSEKNEAKVTVLKSPEGRNRGTKDSPVYGLKNKEDLEMKNRCLTLKTSIEISFTNYKKLMREVIDADPSKGMSITIKEIKDLQRDILEDVRLLNKLHSEKGGF